MQFEFATSARILFGMGRAVELPRLARELGRRSLVVTGRSTARAEPLARALEATGIQATYFCVPGEPTVTDVRQGVKAVGDSSADFLIGFGGGSAVDAAKAIAAVAANSGEPMDYLEVIGQGQRLDRAPLPWMAVPTTAGTGAEVTRNAVLGSREHGLKASLRGAGLLAKVAVVDPELTFDLPKSVTANSGLDALTQLIEAYVSVRANAMTDALCESGLEHVRRSLKRAIQNGEAASRQDMSLAALFSGLALNNAGLGIVHGFAAPLGGKLEAAHGAICAAVLPYGMAANIAALGRISADSLAKYRRVAQILTGMPGARPDDGVQWVRDLCEFASIRPLSAYGLSKDQVPLVAAKVETASSTKGNPIQLTRGEIEGILQRAL